MSRRHRLVVAVVAGMVALSAVAVAGWWATRAVPTDAGGTSLERVDDYGAVPPFTLMERSGKRVSRDDLAGTVWVADFIYTQCTETCPAQSLQFSRLQTEFAPGDPLRFVSITVDPEHDTPEVLQRYADRYGATDRWWFLTGDKREIYCLAQKGFRLSVVDPAATSPPTCGEAFLLGPRAAWASHGSKGLIMHSARFVLVDAKGRIRAYHLATDPDSVGKLAANVRGVLDEAPGRAR
jgi:protein SCO1/2